MTTHPTPEALACEITLMLSYIDRSAEDHTPHGYPAVQQMTLDTCGHIIRTLSAELAAARAEAERLNLRLLSAERGEADAARAEALFRDAEALLTTSEKRLTAERDSLRAEVERLRKPLDAQAARAIAVSLELGRVSVSSVQRKLEIGWKESQALCQRIVDAGWVDGLPLAPILTAPPVAEGV
jgi:hypothetical protein